MTFATLGGRLGVARAAIPTPHWTDESCWNVDSDSGVRVGDQDPAELHGILTSHRLHVLIEAASVQTRPRPTRKRIKASQRGRH